MEFERLFVYLHHHMKKSRTLTLLTLVVSIGLAGACGSRQEKSMQQEFLRVKDSIDMRNFASAHQMIDANMAAASDSDTYYLWLAYKADAWYTAMNVDSFSATSERIHHYLLRHEQQPNSVRQRLWAEWLMERGVYHAAILGQPDSGIVYTKQALDRMAGRNDWGMRVMGQLNLAEYYRQAGQLDKSTDVYLQTLQLADSLDASDEEYIAILLGISTAYMTMGDFANSEQWWNRAAENLTKMRLADKFLYYNNRGNDYYFQDRYSEALQSFRQAETIVKGDSNEVWDYYTARTNLGEIYLCLNNTDSARTIIHEIDSFYSKVNFPPLVYYITTEKMKLALLEGRTADAAAIVSTAKEPDGMIPAQKVMRLKVVEQVMKQTGNWQGAYNAHCQMQSLNDSIQEANIRMQMSARLMQYEHDKRLLEQQRTIDHQKLTGRLAWTSLAVALLALAIISILALLYRRRQRLHELRTRQQIVSLRMENTRNRLTPHFIYNALNHEMLGQMDGKAVDFSALTTLLRRGIEQADMLETTLDKELAFVDYYVEIEGRQIGSDFHYVKEIAEDIDTEAIRLPAMIIQIFAENAIKHGLRRQGGILTIRVTHQQQAILIEVIDNGQGLKNGSSYQEHTGLRVVRQTIQMLNEHNRNHQPITFGINNIEHGCRSWMLLPHEYDFQL